MMLPAHERQRLLFYNTMIRSVLHYVSTMWTSCDKQNLGRVLKLRKTAATVISDADNQVSSVKFFNRLQQLPFYEESEKTKCCIAYKCIEGEVPYILKTLKYSTVMNIVVLLDIETLILFAGGLIE